MCFILLFRKQIRHSNCASRSIIHDWCAKISVSFNWPVQSRKGKHGNKRNSEVINKKVQCITRTICDYAMVWTLLNKRLERRATCRVSWHHHDRGSCCKVSTTHNKVDRVETKRQELTADQHIILNTTVCDNIMFWSIVRETVAHTEKCLAVRHVWHIFASTSKSVIPHFLLMCMFDLLSSCWTQQYATTLRSGH